MSGKNSGLNPLKTRKQLLIATSELNRAHLVQEFATLAKQSHELTCQAMSVKSFFTATASLVAGFIPSRRHPPAAAKSSWLPAILQGVELVSTFWQTFRRPNRD